MAYTNRADGKPISKNFSDKADYMKSGNSTLEITTKKEFTTPFTKTEAQPKTDQRGGPVTQLELDDAIDTRAPASHTHTIANITNLQTTLDGKVSKSGDNEMAYQSTINFPDNNEGGSSVSMSGIDNVMLDSNGGFLEGMLGCSSLQLIKSLDENEEVYCGVRIQQPTTNVEGALSKIYHSVIRNNGTTEYTLSLPEAGGTLMTTGGNNTMNASSGKLTWTGVTPTGSQIDDLNMYVWPGAVLTEHTSPDDAACRISTYINHNNIHYSETNENPTDKYESHIGMGGYYGEGSLYYNLKSGADSDPERSVISASIGREGIKHSTKTYDDDNELTLTGGVSLNDEGLEIADLVEGSTNELTSSVLNTSGLVHAYREFDESTTYSQSTLILNFPQTAKAGQWETGTVQTRLIGHDDTWLLHKAFSNTSSSTQKTIAIPTCYHELLVSVNVTGSNDCKWRLTANVSGSASAVMLSSPAKPFDPGILLARWEDTADWKANYVSSSGVEAFACHRSGFMPISAASCNDDSGLVISCSDAMAGMYAGNTASVTASRGITMLTGLTPVATAGSISAWSIEVYIR